MSNIENRLLSGDDYVRERAEQLSNRGFLPPLDFQSPNTEQMKVTMSMQESLSSELSESEVKVPDQWVDPDKTSETNFRSGVLENGVVVSVMLETNSAVREQPSDRRSIVLASGSVIYFTPPTREEVREIAREAAREARVERARLGIA